MFAGHGMLLFAGSPRPSRPSMAIPTAGGDGPHRYGRSAAEDGGGAAILLRDAKPGLRSMTILFGNAPGRRKIVAPPPLRAGAGRSPAPAAQIALSEGRRRGHPAAWEYLPRRKRWPRRHEQKSA
ncbi:MAG: hypothetical protein B7Z75_14450 [Acidocella sp. 20-57-95]|nr:MAG: hypothetical protein B7Z75_14450 [Acidocella sp. 20-57-95]